MAVKLGSMSGTLKVVAWIDEALDMTREEYDEYLKDLDESKLKLHDGITPTRFVMRRVIPYELAQQVRDHQVEAKVGSKDMKAKISFTMEEVRCSLIDIENPPELDKSEWIEFKKDGEDDGACKELMAQLHSVGIVTNLYSARLNVLGNLDEVDGVKKK